jgi:hypothetical protein
MGQDRGLCLFVIVGGETVNPRLHVAMHRVVANQLLADDPPEAW